MRKQAPTDSSRQTSVRGWAGYSRPSHAQSAERGRRLTGQLTIPAAALLLTAVLAACGSAAAPSSAAAGSASQAAAGAGSGKGSTHSAAPSSTPGRANALAAARRVQCPALDGAADRGLRAEPIPAGFSPVGVVECIRIPAIVPVAGPGPEEIRRMAFGDLDRLVAALRMPSTPRSRLLVPACLLPVDEQPWIVLIGPDGRLLRPRVPIGACGLPIVPVQVSLSSLHWKTLSSTPGVTVSPQPANGSPVPNINSAITAQQPGALS
jgi:hypothetical protein